VNPIAADSMQPLIAQRERERERESETEFQPDFELLKRPYITLRL